MFFIAGRVFPNICRRSGRICASPAPKSRVTYSIAQVGDDVRVVADISMVTNPGTGHEERTDMNDTAKDAVAHETQSFLDDLRTELNIAQIVRQEAAAKKAGNGVNYGALVRRSAISITRRSRDGARRLKLLTLD